MMHKHTHKHKKTVPRLSTPQIQMVSREKCMQLNSTAPVNETEQDNSDKTV